MVQKFDDPSDCPPSKGPTHIGYSSHHAADSWVRVSPKKRIRPLLSPRQKKTSNLKPQDIALVPSTSSSPLLVPTQAPMEKEKGILAPIDPHGIILANPNAMKPQDGCSTPSDNLLAMVEDGGEGFRTPTQVTNASINSHYTRKGHCPSKALTLNAFGPRKFMHVQYRISLFHKYTQQYAFELQNNTHAVTFCDRLNNVSTETGGTKLGLGFKKRAL
ncbi:hypothetical protein Cgig2_011117 [Carnegiea gigantea]|uniref:Uncharacterized protein n=1 Tax=Carnegiea gigantea TaxID=171969 RepID=A0A9Q1Q7E1_9CARY|nr:hypothetical protein Cgig2_011117 [Carnegiea gigantea]